MHIFIITFAIICRIFSNSLSNVFQKKLAGGGEHPACVNFYNYLILSLFSLPILFKMDFSFINMQFIIYAILGGVFGALCNCFMVLALEKGELSVLGPINSYKAIVGLIFAIFILGEYPDIYGIVGVILIILGSFFIFDNPKDIFKQDIRYRFYALFFSAVEAVFIKKVIILSSISVSFAASSILGAMFSLLLAKYMLKTGLKFPDRKYYSKYFLTAVFFAIMTFTTAFVFKYMNVGYALSLFQLSIIVNVVLGWKLFKEKNLLRKLAGSFIILIGSTIILIISSHI